MTNPHISEHPLFPPHLAIGPSDHDCYNPAKCFTAAKQWLTNQDLRVPPTCLCSSIAAILDPWRRSLLPDPAFKHLQPLATLVSHSTATPALTIRRHFFATARLLQLHLPEWLRAANLPLQADRVANAPFSSDPHPAHPGLMPFLDLLDDVHATVRRLTDTAPDSELVYPASATDATARAGTTALGLPPVGTPTPWPQRDLLPNLVSSLSTDAAVLAPLNRGRPHLELHVRRLQRNTLSTIRRMASLR